MTKHYRVTYFGVFIDDVYAFSEFDAIRQVMNNFGWKAVERKDE